MRRKKIRARSTILSRRGQTLSGVPESQGQFPKSDIELRRTAHSTNTKMRPVYSQHAIAFARWTTDGLL